MKYNPEYSVYKSKFQLYVAWVDHNDTIKGEQKKGVVDSISPQTGRNLHIGGFKLNAEGGGVVLAVLVPQDLIGTFKMPQIGDIVWIEESRRAPGETPTYLYSTYNSAGSEKRFGPSPVPQWGSLANDYGHLRTHRDHNRQFFSTVNSSFTKKYMKSVTGYRFRHYYRSNLVQGRFSVRGDPVFDINPSSDSKEYLVSEGEYIIEGSDLTLDRWRYPNPLNTPKVRELNDNYKYVEAKNKPVDFDISADHYKTDSTIPGYKPEYEELQLKNKNYYSYQPILDKKYLNKASFERELPAAEEYQVALRGNNKLLIQDHYGDGEQLLITLKNQYDAGFTIVHNKEKSQVRIRDHLGQGVLLEANPDAPRVMSWTTNRQVVEQGSVKDVGAYTYLRNGDAFGDSDTRFGTKNGIDKDNVSNQEILMTSTGSIAAEISQQLSSGMRALATGASAAGIFMRNNIDPELSNQTFSMYNNGSKLVSENNQEYLGENGITEKSNVLQEVNGTEAKVVHTVVHDAPGAPTSLVHEEIAQAGVVFSRRTMTNAGATIVNEETMNNPVDVDYTITATNANADKSVLKLDTDGLETSLTQFKAGLKESEIILSDASVKLTHYAGAVPISTVEQTDTTLDIKREMPGIIINLGNDTQSDPINIGNINADVNILGATVNVEGTTTQIGKVGATNNIIGTTDFSQ